MNRVAEILATKGSQTHSVAPDTTVVVVSALGRRQSIAERARLLGAAGYIEKARLGSTPTLVASLCSAA